MNKAKVVKVCYLGETKRLKVTTDYQNLVEQTQKAFGELPSPFKFYYLDEESEMISISSQSDFQEALGIEDFASLKLTVAKNTNEARSYLFKQISDTQSIRDSLNQSGFFQPESQQPRHQFDLLSMPSNVTTAPATAPATERETEDQAKRRVANIMKSIDSDFEDLEEPKAEPKVEPKAEPKIEPKAQPKVEPKQEVKTEVPVVEQKNSQQDEVRAQVQELLAAGSASDDEECSLTGYVVNEELTALIPLVREEVRTFCRASFKSLLEDHLKARKEAQDKVVHEGYACDGCDMCPITGIRYKCTVRDDYDLCGACEEKGVSQHPMLKIRRPEHAPASITCQYKMLNAMDRDSVQARVTKAMEAVQASHQDKVDQKVQAAKKKIEEQMAPGTNQIKEVNDMLGKKFAECLNQEIPQPQQQKARGFGTKEKDNKKFVKYSARFVKESFGDRHPVMSGAPFTKSWTLRNDGKHEWPADATLINTNGDDMQAKPKHIGSVQPDHEAEIKLDLVAPTAPGRYSTYFRMRTGDTYRFGHKIWADILVEEPKAAPVIEEPKAAPVIKEPKAEPVIEEPKVVEAPVPVKEPEMLSQDLDNLYPDIELYEEVTMADKVAEVPSPIVETIQPSQPSQLLTTPTVNKSELSTSISQVFVTPKQRYFEKVATANVDVQENLRELFEMGFTNFEINSGMLKKYNNDVTAVAGLLCEGALSESCVNYMFN